MYEVYLDGKNLYYPGDQINILTSAELDRKLNESGTFKITVPPTNPLFDSFQKRVSEVKILKNGDEIWNGEVRGEKGTFRKEKVIEVVGELSYLSASSQPQKVYENYNTLQAFTAVLNEHNARVEPRKQFAVGIVTVDNVSTTWTTNYEQTLEYIRSEMCSKLDGYLRIRKENGVRYLDLVKLEDYGKTCNQTIEFGRNMLDYASNITADSIDTVIRPLGSKLDESVVEGLDAYVTIESVNNGKDYIENTDAINSGIGKVWKTVHFNVLSDPAAVKTAGENWLKANQFENMVLSVSAVDLSDVNIKIDAFDLGDRTRVKAKPFGMDKWSYITESKIDLLNPEIKNNITIGERVKKSYTQTNASAQNDIKNLIPEQTVVLELAKENASEIIKTASEGFIHIVYNEKGKPKELLIMDTDDINTAKKVWRWNINGLGYSKTGYNGTFGLAMTIDGAIVADFITVGELSADRISGGSITTSIFKAVGKVIRYAKDYSSADAERANSIILGNIAPTIADLEKLDIDADGVITISDLVRINQFLNGILDKYEIATAITIDPFNTQSVLKTEGVSLGVNGIFSKNITSEITNLKQVRVMRAGSGYVTGYSGSFTTSDGKTVTCVSGIITSVG